MAKISTNRKAGTQHPRENFLGSGNLAALNAEFIVDCDGASSFGLDLRGTFNMTVEVSGTIDNVNWLPIPIRPFNRDSLAYVPLIVGTAAGLWVGKCAPFDRLRVRVPGYTSGACIASLLASNAMLDDTLQGMVTTTTGTVTAAVGVGATLTIPAPGAGLRPYLTYLRIARAASVLLTAAATPVIISTTNIPGGLAFSVPANAAPAGDIWDYQEAFNFPLATAAQNVATTIVCPATPNVIWRATAGWYLAP